MRRNKRKNHGLRNDVKELIQRELHKEYVVLSKKQLEKLSNSSASSGNSRAKAQFGGGSTSDFFRIYTDRNFEKKIGASVVTYVIRSVISKIF